MGACGAESSLRRQRPVSPSLHARTVLAGTGSAIETTPGLSPCGGHSSQRQAETADRRTVANHRRVGGGHCAGDEDASQRAPTATIDYLGLWRGCGSATGGDVLGGGYAKC